MEKSYKLIDGVKCSAVVLSPGFGAGWSTWNASALSWDSRVIDWLIAHSSVCNSDFDFSEDDLDDLGGEYPYEIRRLTSDFEELEKFCETIGYTHVYVGCFCDTFEIAYLPKGTLYRIKEYDGSESIEFYRNTNYITA